MAARTRAPKKCACGRIGARGGPAGRRVRADGRAAREGIMLDGVVGATVL